MNKNQLIQDFFKDFAPAQAIPRINEALAIFGQKLESPILDLGCGDGRFAKIVYGKRGIEVGLDPNPKEIEKARKTQAYKELVISYGDKMPFSDQTFNSVLANSVLEHVTCLDSVLKETNRVLKKDGLFVLTVPNPLVSQYQFWSKFIPGYARFKEKLWRHINYFGEDQWRQRLEKAGFKIEKIEKTNSKKAIAWADIFFPLFPLGPIKWTRQFLEERQIFGLDSKGATLVIWCRRQK